MDDRREHLGQLVRATWVEWARSLPRPKPSWLLTWYQLDPGQREVDMRIGEAVAADERQRVQGAIDRVTSLAEAAQAAAVAASETRLATLRAAVQRVLDDEESGEGGWGPDITMVAVLREAMEATDPKREPS